MLMKTEFITKRKGDSMNKTKISNTEQYFRDRELQREYLEKAAIRKEAEIQLTDTIDEIKKASFVLLGSIVFTVTAGITMWAIVLLVPN